MKIPAVVRTFCPYCRKHTEHTVKIVEPSKQRRSLSKGQRRAERRRKGHGNHGRYSKRAISQWKLRTKTTKKVDLLLTCKECGKSHHRSIKRVKKTPEIVKV